MPVLLGRNQKQLTILEANLSRIVTKFRSAVEIINGFCKSSFKALKEVQNQCLQHTIDDYRIAAALINKFHERLIADSDSLEIASKMIHNLHVDNDLRKFVNTKKLNRTCKYSQINFSDINDFPKLDIESIKNNITFGSYQLKQALSYIAGHLTEYGEHEIFVNENLVDLDKSKLIMAKIQ